MVDAYQAKFVGVNHATLATAACVLLETTGLDFSEDASRLHRIHFPAAVQSKLGAKHIFAELELRDEDSLHLKGNSERLTSPNTGPKNFFLQRSNEYTDVYFEPDRGKAAAAVRHQSGVSRPRRFGACRLCTARITAASQPFGVHALAEYACSVALCVAPAACADINKITFLSK